MMNVVEVRCWLAAIPEDHHVAVDDGGLTLVEVEDNKNYIEIGGVPEDEE